MIAQPFDQGLAFTLPQEGGYVNDPRDAGGATNHGVTQGAYDVFRDRTGQPRRAVIFITDAEVRQLYLEDFWQPACCDSMPSPVAITHFDWSVNHGVSGAKQTLQLCLGVAVDGVVGPATLAAVAALVAPRDFAVKYNAARRAWYLARVQAKPDQAAFLKDWLDRVDALDAFVEKLA